MAHYLDTSALVKLVVAETESQALMAWLAEAGDEWVSSDLARTVDAIDLAAAIDLGDDLEAIVTYDDRLAEAARANGIPTAAPA